MKKIILILSSIALSVTAMVAQTAENVNLARQGKLMTLEMNVSLADVAPGSNGVVVLTPVLRNGQNSAAFRPIAVYSRNQWYYYDRKGQKASGNADEILLRSGRQKSLAYSDQMAYNDQWMNGAELVLERRNLGCCGSEKAAGSDFLVRYRDIVDETNTIIVEKIDTVVKETASVIRSMAGRAFVDFRASSSEVDVNYHSNLSELGHILSTIDSLKTAGVNIVNIEIRGYASPDGPYKKNAALAEARTNAIANYVRERVNLPADAVVTSWEAENWAGLREFVAASSLKDKDAILKVIDSDEQPDAKESTLKKKHAASYEVLRKECFPFLRRTDYRINYTVETKTEK